MAFAVRLSFPHSSDSLLELEVQQDDQFNKSGGRKTCTGSVEVGRNLRESFFDALDHYSANLMDISRRRKALLVSFWRSFYVRQGPTDVRSLCLRGLPVILGDDPSTFFKTCSDVTDEDSYHQIPAGILCVDAESPQVNPSQVCIILEGISVMKPDNLPQAFCLLFGLIYGLHLDYPKCMKNTFHFIQQVFFNLGKVDLAPKIQSLKSQLTVTV